MEITKFVADKRLNELNAQLEQTKITLQAIFGAIQECNYWINYLDKSDEEEKSSSSINLVE